MKGLFSLLATAFALAAGSAATWIPQTYLPLPNGLCPPKFATPGMQQAIFNDFVETFYIEGNIKKALLNFVSEDYIQHNPFVSSGRKAALKVLPGAFKNATIDVLHVVFQDSVGVVHYRVTQSGSPVTAYADFFRLNGTCVAEHWDVIESLPPNATNPLALF
ncbi:hypothetical protein V1506DRAFT_548614 [Lipomyces tetrasporus]